MLLIERYLPKVVLMEDAHAQKVQEKLLKIILVITCVIAAFTVGLAWFDILPFSSLYTEILALYTLLNMFSYYALHKGYIQYSFTVNFLMFFSLFTFAMMSAEVNYDALRMLWFFLLSFAAYILGGKWYGVGVSVVIVSIVAVSLLIVDLHLSHYEIFTFFASFIAFSAFAFYFLWKIHIDNQTFQAHIDQEIIKRQTQEQILLRHQRMVHMGEMIDAIAHQWRQPLMQGNMILLNMQEELDNTTYIEEKIDALSKLNQHMSQTIDDFRTLLHDQKEKKVFGLKVCMMEVATLMTYQLKNIEIIYDIQEKEQILGYKNECIQVMIILLSNASDALIYRKIHAPKIIISHKKDKQWIQIEVLDNAGGIDEVIRKKLFDPYVGTQHKEKATGLGLYIAKIIVEETMQGILSVSHAEEGAKFIIKLKRQDVNT